jgi:hypothetical protein
MSTKRLAMWCVAAGFWAVLGTASSAFGNGGPFLIKYPNGDPAAKGVLARLDPSLRPARETKLRVVKEDLDINFSMGTNLFGDRDSQPLASVSAAYTIENPTREEVKVEFGFPILRGIYMSPWSMMPTPEAWINVDGGTLKKPEIILPQIISNSVIYGIIRQRARETIDDGIAADAELAKLAAATRKAAGLKPPSADQASQQTAKPAIPSYPKEERKPPQPTADYAPAREALRDYLVKTKNWNERDAALLVEYASLDFGITQIYPRDRWSYGFLGSSKENNSIRELLYANMGPLAAIGEQKTTQFFAQLAAQFDKQAAATYEGIFSAWGGDVRERSIDLDSGKIRPREIEVKKGDKNEPAMFDRGDSTVYARLDYLDPDAKISETEKASCLAALKNLPVVFTFAPMNLLHYQVTFPAKQTRVVKVMYKQYAYLDTRGTPSYQLAYVLHPASFWNDFGPIQLSVQSPKEVACRASIPFSGKVEIKPEIKPDAKTEPVSVPFSEQAKYPIYRHEARLEKNQDKTGELFIGIDKAAWDKFMKEERAKIKKPE